MSDGRQLTVAELIAVLSSLPQEAKVWVEGDYGVHHCDGAHQEGDRVYVGIG